MQRNEESAIKKSGKPNPFANKKKTAKPVDKKKRVVPQRPGKKGAMMPDMMGY